MSYLSSPLFAFKDTHSFRNFILCDFFPQYCLPRLTSYPLLCTFGITSLLFLCVLFPASPSNPPEFLKLCMLVKYQHNQDTRAFPSLQKVLSCPFASNPLLSPQATGSSWSSFLHYSFTFSWIFYEYNYMIYSPLCLISFTLCSAFGIHLCCCMYH